jgi:hypothetical protein
MKCHMNIIHEMPACLRIDLAQSRQCAACALVFRQYWWERAVKQQRYWVALFNRGGERAGVERELAREPRLEVARARYNESVATYPDRLVMLCDRATA